MNGRFIVGLLLVLAMIVLAAGVGVYAYNIGVAQGLAETGKITTPYPFYAPYFFPFGFGFFGFLGPLFGFLIFFAILRAVLWGRYWGRPWRGYRHFEEGQVPPAVEEWHRKMHESKQS